MRTFATSLSKNFRVTYALMMREIVTRYGREGLGFLWLIGEPLMFCLGVLTLWTLMKPEYEHGVRVAPFIMTGYMCLLLLRHTVSYSVNAVQANVGLLYHRQVRILHIYLSRSVMEFAGASVAFIVVYTLLFVMGSVELPDSIVTLYCGWLLLAWFSTGLALVFAGLAMEFDVMERIVPVFMYLMIPLSGAFIMASWLPSGYRDLYLLLPIPNAIEMVRDGVFGDSVPTFYHAWYMAAWSAGLCLLGLALLARSQNKLEIE
ncbi:ABC transporter [Brevundimonas nasdae]|uniref:ABC transporter n=2 Tax=Brevundimonas nasdae TaxID=172043 RepID=A0A0B4CWE5_9CAUL|nr:ABC transporter [Brevundimonas nasdae]